MMTILHVTILRRISKSQGKAFCKELGMGKRRLRKNWGPLLLCFLSLPNRKL